MEQIRDYINRNQAILGTILVVILLGALAYLAFSFAKVSKENDANLEVIRQLNEEKASLISEVEERDQIIAGFEGQIEDIGTTVGNLKKLSETDEELLKKYSKVYFLNENYVPSRLTEIPEKYLYQPERKLYIHKEVWPHLQELIDNARTLGHELMIASAYRSFGDQATLKYGYTVTYGSGANQFSADQGYSEHQLGTTIDFTTPENGANFDKFRTTGAYKWLLDNAYTYGFTLSYPEGNEFYKFEPWHWRFVGLSLAKFLHNERLNFYDVSQREIDKYLINIFDE